MALSEYDKKYLDKRQQQAIRTYTAQYERAVREGNQKAAQAAHEGAEAVRRRAGYSGGAAGGGYITPSSAQSAPLTTERADELDKLLTPSPTRQNRVPISRAIEQSNARILYDKAYNDVKADKRSVNDIYSNDFAAREAARRRREDNKRRLQESETLMRRLGLGDELAPNLGERAKDTLTGAGKLYGAQAVGATEWAANAEEEYQTAREAAGIPLSLIHI